MVRGASLRGVINLLLRTNYRHMHTEALQPHNDLSFVKFHTPQIRAVVFPIHACEVSGKPIHAKRRLFARAARVFGEPGESSGTETIVAD